MQACAYDLASLADFCRAAVFNNLEDHTIVTYMQFSCLFALTGNQVEFVAAVSLVNRHRESLGDPCSHERGKYLSSYQY
jgi:hypothetical protein